MSTRVRILAVERILHMEGKVTVEEIQYQLAQKYGITSDRRSIYEDMLVLERYMPICKGWVGKKYRYWIRRG